MGIEIRNTGTEGEEKAQDRLGAKEEGKDVKSIDVAGAVKEGNAKNEEEASWVWQCGSLELVSLGFLGISCIPSYP